MHYTCYYVFSLSSSVWTKSITFIQWTKLCIVQSNLHCARAFSDCTKHVCTTRGRGNELKLVQSVMYMYTCIQPESTVWSDDWSGSEEAENSHSQSENTTFSHCHNFTHSSCSCSKQSLGCQMQQSLFYCPSLLTFLMQSVAPQLGLLSGRRNRGSCQRHLWCWVCNGSEYNYSGRNWIYNLNT